MRRRDPARSLRWYPAQWRARYGDELVALMEDTYGDRPQPLRQKLSLVLCGVRERARSFGLTGDSAPAEERVRAGAMLVLGAWALFVLAGSSFAKLSEHFDNALPGGIDNPSPPGGAHHLPDLAFTLVQSLATLAGIAVIIGVAVALPALLRFLRSGGWGSLRAHVVRAGATSGLAIATTIPLVIWAGHLTSQQRNGGAAGYTALFGVWAALLATSLCLWTAVAIAAARRIVLSRRVLALEALLAVALTLGMFAMLGATALWWASMATDAPHFIATRPGAILSDPQLTITVFVMVIAVGVAATGSVRIARSLSLPRPA